MVALVAVATTAAAAIAAAAAAAASNVDNKDDGIRAIVVTYPWINYKASVHHHIRSILIKIFIF